MQRRANMSWLQFRVDTEQYAVCELRPLQLKCLWVIVTCLQQRTCGVVLAVTKEC